MTSVAEPSLERETFIVRARALRHVRDTFVRNTPPTTKRVRFSVVSQPRGTHSYKSHPRSQTLSRKATNDRFCVLLEEDEAPVTHFGPGCNGGISISIVLRHGTGHGTMTATKIMREILEDNRKVNPSFQTRFPPVFNCTLPIRHQVSPARKSRVASFAFAWGMRSLRICSWDRQDADAPSLTPAKTSQGTPFRPTKLNSLSVCVLPSLYSQRNLVNVTLHHKHV
mmetsp:Transcript_13302/g.57897  ORF Transcript_13302/g.57897 Transcript_13302/m.57897 type:complete len:225 (+) Transcript_13302:120-794(+)